MKRSVVNYMTFEGIAAWETSEKVIYQSIVETWKTGVDWR